MEIYIVMIDEKHSDTEAHLFSAPESALEYARAMVRWYAGERNKDKIEETEVAGWLYSAWVEDSFSIWVVAKELDDPETIDVGNEESRPYTPFKVGGYRFVGGPIDGSQMAVDKPWVLITVVEPLTRTVEESEASMIKLPDHKVYRYEYCPRTTTMVCVTE